MTEICLPIVLVVVAFAGISLAGHHIERMVLAQRIPAILGFLLLCLVIAVFGEILGPWIFQPW